MNAQYGYCADDPHVPAAPDTSASIMTELGMVEGEILTYLEERGASTVREVVRELPRPTREVWMAVGALIRAGLVRGVQHELEIVLVPCAFAAQRHHTDFLPETAPDIWRR